MLQTQCGVTEESYLTHSKVLSGNSRKGKNQEDSQGHMDYMGGKLISLIA
jgi:hypothetical protein